MSAFGENRRDQLKLTSSKNVREVTVCGGVLLRLFSSLDPECFQVRKHVPVEAARWATAAALSALPVSVTGWRRWRGLPHTMAALMIITAVTGSTLVANSTNAKGGTGTPPACCQ